jgi:hypothetical protein
MLHFQMGTFRGLSDDGGFLIVEIQGPPLPVSTIAYHSDEPKEETASDPVTVSKRNKRKVNTTSSELNASQKRILPSNDTNGIVYKTDGTTEVVDGPFDGSKLKDVIDCTYFQMVPCTEDDLKDKFELWMNEEGQMENDLNEEATKIFGKQVFGGELYGNVLVVKCGAID